MKVESGDSGTSTARKKLERGASSSGKAAKKKVERGESRSSKAAKKKKEAAPPNKKRSAMTISTLQAMKDRAAEAAAAAPLNKKRSAMTIATLKVMEDRALKRADRKTPGVTVRHFDNTDVGYDWLLPGWIAEERFVPSGRQGTGRLYKYYYDPAGRQYNTRREVLYAWEKTNLICLDA